MSTNSTSEPRELTETPDLNGAYPRLDEAGIAALAPLGHRRRVQREEVLFREGDRDCQFFMVLATSGAELAERAMLQARKFGAEFVVPAEAASIEKDGGQCLAAGGSPEGEAQ
jgi:hypothetical protein